MEAGYGDNPSSDCSGGKVGFQLVRGDFGRLVFVHLSFVEADALQPVKIPQHFWLQMLHKICLSAEGNRFEKIPFPSVAAGDPEKYTGIQKKVAVNSSPSFVPRGNPIFGVPNPSTPAPFRDVSLKCVLKWPPEPEFCKEPVFF